MKAALTYIVSGLAGLAMLLGLMWLFQGNAFVLYRHFAPKYEAVRRETFEQSKAYNQGMIQRLDNVALQYADADTAHKAALASLALHEFADYDEAKLPAHLALFLHSLRNARLTGVRP